MIFFSPSGSLDVAKDPSDLPQSVDQNSISSDAMVRCKNLRINQRGIAKTRDGSAKLNASAISAEIWWIEVQGTTRYTFAGTVIYEDETSIKTGLTSAQWAAIQYNAYNDTAQQVFALNGTDRKRIQSGTVYEWGIAAPETAPILGPGHGSGLTGEYNVKYTYLRKSGTTVICESDPSPAGTSIVLDGQSVSVDLAQPTDPQVTHIRLYRTTADGASYFYDQEIAVGVTYTYGYMFDWELSGAYLSGTGYPFTTADATNSSEDTFSWEERFTEMTSTVTDSVYSAPFDDMDSVQADSALGDLIANDHDRPPLGSFVFGPAYDGTCFILKDNLLHYCKPKQPEYWPSLYYIEVSTPQFPLKTGVFHNGQPYVFSKNEIFYIQGTGDGTFFPLPMKAKTGAQSVKGAASVAGKGIYHTGPDGIYLWGNGADTKITEDGLEPLFRGEDTQGMNGVGSMTTAWIHVFSNHLYFGYSSTSDGYPDSILVLNLDTSRVVYYDYGLTIRAIATDHGNARLLIGDSTGYVRVIESTSYTDDAGTAISWEVQSKDFELQTRKHFPRWNKYDVDATDATTCTGALILDGVVHQSHTITGDRLTKRRLVEIGNGNKCAISISGSGPVSIYAAESE